MVRPSGFPAPVCSVSRHTVEHVSLAPARTRMICTDQLLSVLMSSCVPFCAVLPPRIPGLIPLSRPRNRRYNSLLAISGSLATRKTQAHKAYCHSGRGGRGGTLPRLGKSLGPGPLLIKPSQDSIKPIKRTLKGLWRTHVGSPTVALINAMNPVSRG